MATPHDMSIMIDNESFSLLKIPRSDTGLVLKQKNLILGMFDFPALVYDMGRVGKFVYIAYNAVAGFTELQIQIREISVDITKLCDESAVTMFKFKTASGSALEGLQATYEFLLDGLEEMALISQGSLAGLAQGMASAADELQKKFHDEASRVEKALKETQLISDRQKKLKQEFDNEEEVLQAGLEAAPTNQKSAETDLEQFTTMYETAESRQHLFEKSASYSLKHLANFIAAPLRERPIFDTDGDYAKAQQACEEKLKRLDDMKKQQDLRLQSLQQLAEFPKKIKRCQDESKQAKLAMEALHNAAHGLKMLAAVMMKAALFWKKLQAHCETLSSTQMKQMIEAAVSKPQSEKMATWTKPSFMKHAIHYYGMWVALDDVCETYMHRIREVQTDLYAYLTENPTVEEARKNVQELARTFVEDLAKEKKAIIEADETDQARRQVQQEMKELEEEHKND